MAASRAGMVAGAALLAFGIHNVTAFEAAPEAPAATQQVGGVPNATAVALSPALQDVLKLVHAKVNPEIVKAFIRNQPVPYRPTADQIIALQSLGVTSDILEEVVAHRSPELAPLAVEPEPSAPPEAEVAPVSLTTPGSPTPLLDAAGSTVVYTTSYPVYYTAPYNDYYYYNDWWWTYRYPFWVSFSYWPYYSYYGCWPYWGWPYCGYPARSYHHHDGYGPGKPPGHPGGHDGRPGDYARQGPMTRHPAGVNTLTPARGDASQGLARQGPAGGSAGTFTATRGSGSPGAVRQAPVSSGHAPAATQMTPARTASYTSRPAASSTVRQAPVSGGKTPAVTQMTPARTPTYASRPVVSSTVRQAPVTSHAPAVTRLTPARTTTYTRGPAVSSSSIGSRSVMAPSRSYSPPAPSRSYSAPTRSVQAPAISHSYGGGGRPSMSPGYSGGSRSPAMSSGFRGGGGGGSRGGGRR